MKELDPLTRLESLYRQTLDGLDAVRRVGEILGETFDERNICERAVRIFVEVLPFENCSILLLDPGRTVLRLQAAAGKSDHLLATEVRKAFNRDLEIRVGEGIAGEVVQTGRPALVANAGRDPKFKPLPSPLPIRSLLCLPLHSKNECIGVINLSHPEIEEISIDQEKTLEVLSRMVGQCITISRLSFQIVSERLQRSERLRTLGQLSASVAHEVNNPLTNILLRAQRLKEAEGIGDRDRSLAAEIEEESEKIAGILGTVLDFSRAHEARARATDVHQSIQRALDLTLPLHAERGRIRVHRALQTDLPPAMVDPHQLEQVFTNLVMNAVHAMGRSGEIFITTRAQTENVEVLVRDTGPGIDPSHAQRIFEPFYTTHPEDGGTGLGLAVSREILRSHGGDLTVDCRHGEGAEFRVSLPRMDRPSGVDSARPRDQAGVSGTSRSGS